MPGEPLATKEIFDSAVSIVRNLPKEGAIKPSDDLKLKFYAYFKQATHGPNDTPKPRFYQIVEAYKWDAWKKLGDMSKEDAMQNYIRELKQVMETIPPDEADTESSKHFETLLGKKFYDYWFSKWQYSDKRRLIEHPSSSRGAGDGTQSSSSSSDSSVSMLEESNSLADGYKTPTSQPASRERPTTVSESINDQFAAALLRLQHNLDNAMARLESLENQMQQSASPRESQTHAKRYLESESQQRNNKARSSLSPSGNSSAVVEFLRANWFHLTYPVVVYLVMNAIQQRQRRSRHR